MLMMILDFLPNTAGCDLSFHCHYFFDIVSLVSGTLVSALADYLLPPPSFCHIVPANHPSFWKVNVPLLRTSLRSKMAEWRERSPPTDSGLVPYDGG